MKKILLTSVTITLFMASYSQAPQAFNYQAILRNSDGTVKTNETVAIQLSIIHGHTDGPPVYLEFHKPTTSEIGLVNLVIGEGITDDDFSSINWANGPYFLDVIVNAVRMGTSPLLSVPYALYAASGNEGPPGPPGEPGPKGDKGDPGEQGDAKWEDATGGINYADGKVGIGTTDPQTHLHISGYDYMNRGQLSLTAPAGRDIFLSMYQNNNWKAYLWWDDSQGDLRLQNYSEGPTNINPYGGNVGIGTITPEEKLEVNGNIRAEGKILVNGQEEVATKSYVDSIKESILSELIFYISDSATIKDIDNNSYKAVKIGNQWWMAENLKVTRYADGTAIPLVEDSAAWVALGYTDQAYCWYDNSTSNRDTYGGLYTWAAAMNGAESSGVNPSGVQGACPNGWHLPSDAEWMELEIHLGMDQANADDWGWRGTDEGGKMKEVGTSHWNSPNTGATNESRFSAIPVGFRDSELGGFLEEGNYATFWSATEAGESISWYRSLFYDRADVDRNNAEMNIGLSVRCVKD
jgi:uncharacterized protein (TIGR02145 family)